MKSHFKIVLSCLPLFICAPSRNPNNFRFATEMQQVQECPDGPEELKLDSVQIGQLKVLGEDAGEIFHRILLDRLKSQFDKRRENLKEASENKEAMLSRQAQLRKAYLSLLGKFPERTPLNPLITGKLDCGNYTIEKIVFESRPDFHVTGNFYLPKQRKGKIPGIYMMSGHSDEGKAAEAYHTAATLFALNGFAVFITDPVCQGERFQHITPEGKQQVPGLTLNHTLLDISSMLTGSDIVAYELRDNIRALDYLAGRPEVDDSRLGITGNSGGGTQTAYLAAFDKRVKAAAPSCYIASFETKFETIGSQDGCQQLHDEGLAGLEEQDLLFLAAPTPVRILSAEQDFFAFEGAQKASQELKEMYSTLGFPEHTDQAHYPGTHGFSRPLREAAVSWMKRWLMNDTIPVKEPENMKLLTPADLTVTSSGQVMSAFPNEQSVTEINIEKLNESRRFRHDFPASVSEREFKKKVKSLLRMEEWEPKQISVSLKGSFMLSGKRVEKLIVSRPGGCPLPGLLFYPERTSDESRIILLVDDHGKAGELKQGGMIEAELEKGNLVFSIDLSGYGELRYKSGKYRNDEFWNANLALYNGKPMFTWLVEDMICGVEGIKVHFSGMKRKIEMLAKGDLCPAALHAAVLCDQINQITLLNPAINSWEEVVKAPYTIKNGYVFLVPRILSCYDLPDMEKFLRSRLTIK
jgi:hypothetical protein